MGGAASRSGSSRTTFPHSGRSFAIAKAIEHELRPVAALPVRLPRDCLDGLFSAYWGRPEMYLESEIRGNISNVALAADDDLAEGLARLEADLQSGAWDRRYAHLRSLPKLDLGHRLLIAELGDAPRRRSRKISDPDG